MFRAWKDAGQPRPPVFIVVCKNTKIAKVVFEWLAEGATSGGTAPCSIDEFRNHDGDVVTIRVDTKVVHETDSGEAKADELRWIRFTLDTVGKLAWPSDRQGRPLYPEGVDGSLDPSPTDGRRRGGGEFAGAGVSV